MAKMGMKKRIGNHIEVWLFGESARICIKEAILTAGGAHGFKCLLNEAIRLCEQYNTEQALKDHPSLFSDETK
jgi:hypothetical protein